MLKRWKKKKKNHRRPYFLNCYSQVQQEINLNIEKKNIFSILINILLVIASELLVIGSKNEDGEKVESIIDA